MLLSGRVGGRKGGGGQRRRGRKDWRKFIETEKSDRELKENRKEEKEIDLVKFKFKQKHAYVGLQNKEKSSRSLQCSPRLVVIR